MLESRCAWKNYIVVMNGCKWRAVKDIFDRPSKLMRCETTTNETLQVLMEQDQDQIRKAISQSSATSDLRQTAWYLTYVGYKDKVRRVFLNCKWWRWKYYSDILDKQKFKFPFAKRRFPNW